MEGYRPIPPMQNQEQTPSRQETGQPKGNTRNFLKNALSPCIGRKDIEIREIQRQEQKEQICSEIIESLLSSIVLDLSDIFFFKKGEIDKLIDQQMEEDKSTMSFFSRRSWRQENQYRERRLEEYKAECTKQLRQWYEGRQPHWAGNRYRKYVERLSDKDPELAKKRIAELNSLEQIISADLGTNQERPLDTEKSEFYDDAGKILYQGGKDERAFQAYNLAIQWNPQNASAYKHRGDMHGESGRFEKALQDYDHARKLGYDREIIENCRRYKLSYLCRFKEASEAFKAIKQAQKKKSPCGEPSSRRDNPSDGAQNDIITS